MTRFLHHLQDFSETLEVVGGTIEEMRSSLTDRVVLLLVDKTNSLEDPEVLTDSLEVEEDVGGDEEALEDKILMKGLGDGVEEASVEVVQDLAEVLVVAVGSEDAEDKMGHLEEEAVVDSEDQICGWTKADLRLEDRWVEDLLVVDRWMEDRLADQGVPWMDLWTGLLVAITIILTTVDVVGDVEEVANGKKEAEAVEEEASLELVVLWMDQTVQWMDLQEIWISQEREIIRKRKKGRKGDRKGKKEGRADGEIRKKVFLVHLLVMTVVHLEMVVVHLEKVDHLEKMVVHLEKVDHLEMVVNQGEEEEEE